MLKKKNPKTRWGKKSCWKQNSKQVRFGFLTTLQQLHHCPLLRSMNAHIPYSSLTPTGLGVTHLFFGEVGIGSKAASVPNLGVVVWRRLILLCSSTGDNYQEELKQTQQSLAVAGLRNDIY